MLWNCHEEIKLGNIPMVWFAGRPMPMVHRAIEISYETLNKDEVQGMSHILYLCE